MIRLQHILFPTDFSEVSLCALPYARSLARDFGATLHCLHVVDDSYYCWMPTGPNALPVAPAPETLLAAAEQNMADFVERHLKDEPVPIVTDVLLGRPFLEIVNYAAEKSIDLIVIATHGRSGLSHVLLGSTAERVVRKAPCPVLTVRYRGETSDSAS